MNPGVKEVVEVAGWVYGMVGVTAAVVQAFAEARRNREQRQAELEQRSLDSQARADDLRWRMAEMGKRLIDEALADEGVGLAMEMLDWPGKAFDVPVDGGVEQVVIERQDYVKSLTVPKTAFTRTDHFICTSFDALFWYFATLEQHLKSGLIDLRDVEFPLNYFIEILARDAKVVANYLDHYGLLGATAFLGRFREWTEPLTSTNEAPAAGGYNNAFTGELIGEGAAARPGDGRGQPARA